MRWIFGILLACISIPSPVSTTESKPLSSVVVLRSCCCCCCCGCGGGGGALGPKHGFMGAWNIAGSPTMSMGLNIISMIFFETMFPLLFFFPLFTGERVSADCWKFFSTLTSYYFVYVCIDCLYCTWDAFLKKTNISCFLFGLYLGHYRWVF